MSEIRILALGDAVGSSGVGYLTDNRCLAKAIRSLGAHFTVVNAENSADGNGILPQSAEELFDAGADILTGGNHTFRRREIYHMLDDCENLLRPANLPAAAQGHGWTVYDAAGIRILVMNLLGTVFMEPLASPFETADAILEKCRGGYDVALVDFHAEATSEKLALARYLTGRVSAVWGTHTHVATADCRILGGHTGFITDLGMSAPPTASSVSSRKRCFTNFSSKLPSGLRPSTETRAQRERCSRLTAEAESAYPPRA